MQWFCYYCCALICVCSVISVIYVSHYSEVNLNDFLKLITECGNIHYIWHWIVLSLVVRNLDPSAKILSASSTITWSHETQFLLCNYVFCVHYFMQVARNSVRFEYCN